VFLAGSSDSFMAVWVDVPKTTVEKHAPAAVALVIDTSGSMAQGNKIAHAREAATRMVSSLRDGDIVSLHAFSDDVRELVAPTRLDAQSRQRIAGTISELSASGGTSSRASGKQASRRWRARRRTRCAAWS
jgi:Mg-chelatase subunit ChlD